jgi:tetratricopeptide (TPR) repeat protein
VIERLFGRQVQLQEADRAFLRKVRDFYEEFARGQGDSPEARASMADGHFRVGYLLSKLGELKKAEAAYRAALTLQKQLAADFPTVPEYRRFLARSHNNLGNLLAATGRPEEAEAAYRAALALQQQLATDFPAVPEYRWHLAASQNNLGNLLATTHRPQEAEAAYRAALALQQQLVADFPTVPQYHQDLAGSHNNLGNLLATTHRPQEAEAAYRAALALQQQLVADFPTVPEYREYLATSHNNLGGLLADTARPQEAEAAYRAALALCKHLAADFPTMPDYANDLAFTLGNLALLRIPQKDFTGARALLEEARPYHQQALQANPRNPTYRSAFRNNRRGMCEVLWGLGDHAAVRQEADELARCGYDPCNDTYAAACLVARCVLLAAQDGQLSEEKRQELARTYADRALELLRQAVGHGYRDAAEMKQDPALAPLRPRADFQQLLAELEKAPPER